MTKRKFKKVEKYHDDVLDQLLDDIKPEEQEFTNYRMMLAAKIDKAIEDKGWTSARFAEVMGKRPSEISKWLSGKHNFTTDTLWAIEKALNVNLIDLGEEKTPDGFTTLRVYQVALSALPSNNESYGNVSIHTSKVWKALSLGNKSAMAKKVFIGHGSKESV